MASYNTFTNLVASPALRSQDCLVSVYPSQAAIYFGGMVQSDYLTPKQMRCVISSSSKQGYLSQVDVYGNSFKVKPQQDDGLMDSSGTPGFLKAGDVVTVFNVGT